MTASLADTTRNPTLRLLPFALIVLLGYGAIGLPLATLPVQIHDHLGYGALTIGITVGLQSIATLISRPLAGNICDTRGGRAAVLLGTMSGIVSGVFYLASARMADAQLGLGILLGGRVLSGVAESLIITGSLGWTIATLGAQQTGRAMVWVGIAMFGAIAAGAPAGLAIFAAHGFAGLALGTVALPLAGLGLALTLPAARGVSGSRLPFHRVVGMIWQQGAGLALASVGFGAIATFVALDFRSHGWSGAGLALSAFGAAYILARLTWGHLPDRIGGEKVARVSLLAELLGLLLLWNAHGPEMAIAGAFLTGGGFSLVFPSFGIEVVRLVPPASRGAALGGYVAFFDIGLAVTGPVLGLVVGGFGYSAAFGVAAFAALLALIPAVRAMFLSPAN